MAKSIIGRKVGMTQVFLENGECVAVSVVKVGPCTVVRKKSAQGADGYDAIVLGFEDARSCVYEGETHYKLNKPELGVFKANSVSPKKSLHEVRLSAKEVDKYEQGQELKADLFTAGEYIDVTGTSKGCGFSGVMKRHNYGGSRRSHGVHETFRHGGSLGATSTPGRVMKGKKMAGQMGNEKVTVQNLKVHSVDVDNSLILVTGAIPGANGSVVRITDAVKRRR
ncbi:MAG: 50S ribosomal protein L3 [Bradymonadia bacterium]|jgi:large subunit ribosomal protein L3